MLDIAKQLNHEAPAAVCEWLLRRFFGRTPINWAVIIIFCSSSRSRLHVERRPKNPESKSIW
jgi:hypothetical protein